MRRLFICVLAFLLFTTLTCWSQQTDIKQFSVIAGYSYLHTPSLNLAQRGYNLDFATNYRPWLSLGFDFSMASGGSSLMQQYLSTKTQAALASTLAHLPPAVAGAMAAELQKGVPYNSSTYTYQMGPSLNYRHFKRVTFAVRPALGLLHVKLQTKPSPIVAPLISGLLGGKLSDADTAVFYGLGTGATWEVTPHFGVRATMDFARYNFFGQQLNGARNSVRFTVTTKYSFGRNILRK